MKKLVITYYDKDIENYSPLQVTNYTDVEDLKLDLKNGIRKLLALKELQQYVHKCLKVVALFDNVTGTLEPMDVIIDCDALLMLRKEFVDSLKKSEEALQGD